MLSKLVYNLHFLLHITYYTLHSIKVGNNQTVKTDTLPNFDIAIDHLFKSSSIVKGKLHQNFNSTLGMNVCKSYLDHYKTNNKTVNLMLSKVS